MFRQPPFAEPNLRQEKNNTDTYSPAGKKAALRVANPLRASTTSIRGVFVDNFMGLIYDY